MYRLWAVTNFGGEFKGGGRKMAKGLIRYMAKLSTIAYLLQMFNVICPL